MEQMNLKLDIVFSDMLGKSGQAIITAILKDERSRYLQAMVAAGKKLGIITWKKSKQKRLLALLYNHLKIK